MEDIWVHVEGEIVGWLDQTEHGEYVNDQDIAVIKIARKGPVDKPESIYDDVIGWLPGFCLRWMHNDFTVIEAVDPLNVNIGDKIGFSTNRSEQEKYAERIIIVAEADGLAFDASSHPDNLYDDEGKLK